MRWLVFVSAIALLAPASQVSAADPVALTPAPVVSGIGEPIAWDGFYAGVNAGYGWGSFVLDGLLDQDIAGWLAGAQIGYNWTTNGFVFGWEADYQYSDVNWDGLIGGVVAIDAGLRHFGTARLRLGADLGGVMPYLTAGAAFGQLETISTFMGTTASENDYALGWAAGAGAEAMVTDTMSLKAEYLYAGFPNAAFQGFDLDVETHAVRIGLNHHF